MWYFVCGIFFIEVVRCGNQNLQSATFIQCLPVQLAPQKSYWIKYVCVSEECNVSGGEEVR